MQRNSSTNELPVTPPGQTGPPEGQEYDMRGWPGLPVRRKPKIIKQGTYPYQTMFGPPLHKENADAHSYGTKEKSPDPPTLEFLKRRRRDSSPLEGYRTCVFRNPRAYEACPGFHNRFGLSSFVGTGQISNHSQQQPNTIENESGNIGTYSNPVNQMQTGFNTTSHPQDSGVHQGEGRKVESKKDTSKLLLLASVAERYFKDLVPNRETGDNNTNATPTASRPESNPQNNVNPRQNMSNQGISCLPPLKNGSFNGRESSRSLPSIKHVFQQRLEQPRFPGMGINRNPASDDGNTFPRNPEMGDGPHIQPSSFVLRARYGKSSMVRDDAAAQMPGSTDTGTTMCPERFRYRGHSDGFVSFAEYATADMPSSDLSHFSIMCQNPAAAQSHGNDDRLAHVPTGGLNNFVSEATPAAQHHNMTGHFGGESTRGSDIFVTGVTTSGQYHSTTAQLADGPNEGSYTSLAGAPAAMDEPASFNVFQAMLKEPVLIINLARHLRVQELLILYTICKPFHEIVKLRLTSVILAQAKIRAPEGCKLFPWRCYGRVCMDDPAGRPHQVPEEAAKGVIRKVPTFRWLKMICFREMVVHEIMTIMEEDGTGMPDQCETAIKKVWFLMDIPDNHRRRALVRNREIFTDIDLFFITLFFVKLDMRFTDPITGGSGDGMRRMLLAQPSLTALWRTLKRIALITKEDVIEMFIRWKYEMSPLQAIEGVMGIPPEEIGIVQYEYWGRRGRGTKLEQVDDLLLLESIRRGLNLEEAYPDMFLWGYVNPNYVEELPPVVRKRKCERLEGLEEDLVPEKDKERLVISKQISTRITLQD
ncbi:hypothetical protein VTO42DRAFT_3770 [Malbranchea cinnamomea]